MDDECERRHQRFETAAQIDADEPRGKRLHDGGDGDLLLRHEHDRRRDLPVGRSAEKILEDDRLLVERAAKFLEGERSPPAFRRARGQKAFDPRIERALQVAQALLGPRPVLAFFDFHERGEEHLLAVESLELGPDRALDLGDSREQRMGLVVVFGANLHACAKRRTEARPGAGEHQRAVGARVDLAAAHHAGHRLRAHRAHEPQRRFAERGLEAQRAGQHHDGERRVDARPRARGEVVDPRRVRQRFVAKAAIEAVGKRESVVLDRLRPSFGRHGVACEPCDEDVTQVFQRVGVPGRKVGTGGDEATESGERVALAAFALRLRDELY